MVEKEQSKAAEREAVKFMLRANKTRKQKEFRIYNDFIIPGGPATVEAAPVFPKERSK